MNNITNIKINGEGIFTGEVDLTKIWKKAEAFDLICSHIEILKLLSGNAFNINHPTKEEMEQIAEAMGVTINWKDKE